jgi:PAS domain S-box-containing protein
MPEDAYLKEMTSAVIQFKKALLQLEEQKFALDQHSIVAITDVRGTITYANDKFSQISGYTKEELIGKNHRILNSGQHDMSFWRDMYKVVANGDVWQNTVCNRSKQGELYWVDTTIVPFKGDDGKPFSYISIRTDVTAKRQAEIERIRAIE